MTWQVFTCPGAPACGWTLPHDHDRLQAQLDGAPAVENGVVEPIRAVDAVEVALLGHLGECTAAQVVLERQGRPWSTAVGRQPAPRLRGPQHRRTHG